MPMTAVSLSRISPTRTMSGSARRIERSAPAKVSPAFGWICTWLMPGSRYSTGSSTVMMFRSGVFSWFSVAYSVVDFPEPVGPVTRMVPDGLVDEQVDELDDRRVLDDLRQTGEIALLVGLVGRGLHDLVDLAVDSEEPLDGLDDLTRGRDDGADFGAGEGADVVDCEDV